MAKSGMNPKTLQYIRGHWDIGVTLNTYTHLQFEDALEEMIEERGKKIRSRACEIFGYTEENINKLFE